MGLGAVEAEMSGHQRRDALRPIAEKFAASFRGNGIGRQFSQQKATPALRQLYVQDATERLREDFAALNLKDDAPAHTAKVRDAERRVAKIEKQVADHVDFGLLNFRECCLPVLFRGKPRAGIQHFALHGGAKDPEIGLRILQEFAATWRTVAGHQPEEVSIHGVAISSMPPERRKVWRKAYEAMSLKPATRRPLYQPRCELPTKGDKKHQARVWGSI